MYVCMYDIVCMNVCMYVCKYVCMCDIAAFEETSLRLNLQMLQGAHCCDRANLNCGFSLVVCYAMMQCWVGIKFVVL